jgi:hypothetical protein
MLSSETNITTRINSQLIPTLPEPLAAPAGWRSEIIDSNSPIPTDIGINTNNYEGYNITNTYKTSQINQIPSTFRSNNTGYTNTSINHQQQSILTEQQQRHIVNVVENQYPPPLLLRKTLPNNQVTYKQNVLVKYLQPPTPPPPGPIIIRK